jgi:cathepsin E
VIIAPGVAIRQSIGVASNSSGIYPYDGVLGCAWTSAYVFVLHDTIFCSLSPKYWSIGMLSPDNTSAIPTVTDNLYGQGKIEQNLVAVSFEPTTSAPVINGELTFGGTDSTKYTGDITYL